MEPHALAQVIYDTLPGNGPMMLKDIRSDVPVGRAQAFCGWLYGQFPPGLLANFKLAGAHLLNMFRAHTAAYNAIKELPGTRLQ